MPKRDEQYDTYGYGFEFGYNNRRLSKSKSMTRKEVSGLASAKHNNNDVPIFVKCVKCSEYMDFIGSPELMEGYWMCPSCKAKVKEINAYVKLSKENSSYLES